MKCTAIVFSFYTKDIDWLCPGIYISIYFLLTLQHILMVDKGLFWASHYLHVYFSTDDSNTDQHPEKRMAAAFKAFEEKRLPQIKKENPTLRMSQQKQMLRKEWLKSPENPLNQRKWLNQWYTKRNEYTIGGRISRISIYFHVCSYVD